MTIVRLRTVAQCENECGAVATLAVVSDHGAFDMCDECYYEFRTDCYYRNALSFS
jgi:hypothetical protein